MSLYDRMKEPFVSFAHGFAATDEERLRSLREAWEGACARATTAEAQAAELQERVRVLTEALSDLVSWIPEKPAPSEWRFRAGEDGADDAIEAARTALHDTGQSVGAGRRFTPADVEVAARALSESGDASDWPDSIRLARIGFGAVGTLEKDEG